jgi:uncharacterized protein
MPPIQILVDTSFLIATYNQSDPLHSPAVAGINRRARLLVPQVTLVEAAYMLTERAGIATAIGFLTHLLDSKTPLIPLENEDIARARNIMMTYADAPFDFVDCCLMALAERLKITQIYTFDRRDFRVFRPSHCDYLELLP